MARVFQTLANEGGFKKKVGQFEFVLARAYAPSKADPDYKPKNDVPWLEKFAKDGGKYVLSGDVEMRFKPHECLALQSQGFVTIFFERSWAQWEFFSKSALLMRWWPKVATKLKSAEPGTMWCIPSDWRDDQELRDVTPAQAAITAHRVAIGEIHADNPRVGTRRERRAVRGQTDVDRKVSKRSRRKDESQPELALQTDETSK